MEVRKWKLLFTDGTTEEVEAVGPVTAWIKGKIWARERGTWLLKIEEV
jgi:hypothetical protein